MAAIVSKSSNQLCQEIVLDLLDAFLRKTPAKPTFTNFKRPAVPSLQSQNLKRLRIEAYENEIASLLEKNSHLESELRLVKENLNFEAANKDHWRNSTQAARRELEKQMEENRTLLMRNLEVEDMFQNQTSSCMKVLGDVLTIVWSLSNSTDSLKFLVSGGQLLEFFQLSTKILAQFLEKDQSSSLETAAGLDLVSSVLGCLVNISSCKDLVLTLLGSEHLHSLVDVVVSYLDGCQDQKLLELGLMVLDNLLRTNLHFKAQETLLVSTESMKSLTGLLTRWSVGERGRPSLVKVAERLLGIFDLEQQELEP